MKKAIIFTLITVILLSVFSTNVFAYTRSDGSPNEVANIVHSIVSTSTTVENTKTTETVTADVLKQVIDSFKDIAGHWAENFIAILVNEGIISGYPDGTFRPDNNITVAEFTTLTLKAANISYKSSQGEWYQGIINAAIKEGIIVKGEFADYNRPITRGEIARMVVRTLGEKPSTGKTNFKDDNQIPSNVKGFVKKANELGIIGGYPDGTFKANNNATRAEATVMLTKMKEIKKDIKPQPIEEEPIIEKPPVEDEEKLLQRLYDYPIDGQWVTGIFEDTDYLVKISKEWLPIHLGRDYRNTSGYKDKLKYHIAMNRRSNGEVITADEYMDRRIQEGIDNKIIQESYFLTNKDLVYHGNDYRKGVRGILRFIYHSHDNPPEGIKVGKWYEQDIDIKWIIPVKGEEDYWKTGAYVFDKIVYLSEPRLIQ